MFIVHSGNSGKFTGVYRSCRGALDEKFTIKYGLQTKIMFFMLTFRENLLFLVREPRSKNEKSDN